jgi:hypothetical protein
MLVLVSSGLDFGQAVGASQASSFALRYALRRRSARLGFFMLTMRRIAP